MLLLLVGVGFVARWVIGGLEFVQPTFDLSPDSSRSFIITSGGEGPPYTAIRWGGHL